MKIIRLFYLLFDTLAIHLCDHLIFPNTRQLAMRNAIKKIRDDIQIIPLGAGKPKIRRPSRRPIIGFLGMMKESQGIDLVLQHFDNILSANPRTTLEIIGSGPGEEYLQRLARPFGKAIRFFGFIEDHARIEQIVRRWSVGLAVYKPEESNESYYGDTSKIKEYLSQGVPIITTSVTQYAALAKKHGFGVIIPYRGALLPASIATVLRKNSMMRKNAVLFAEKFYYRKLYKPMFTDLPSR